MVGKIGNMDIFWQGDMKRFNIIYGFNKYLICIYRMLGFQIVFCLIMRLFQFICRNGSWKICKSFKFFVKFLRYWVEN